MRISDWSSDCALPICGMEREGRPEEAAAYDFFPVTFVLPKEYAMFVEEFKRVGGIWIMKPIGSAQGKGIFLFSRLSEISEWRNDHRHPPDGKKDDPHVDSYVVQEYISIIGRDHVCTPATKAQHVFRLLITTKKNHE